MASKKELQWLDRYMETGNDKLATREIFDCAEKSVSSRSAQLKQKHASEIDKRLRETMRTDSVACQKILINLANNAQSEQVQAKAAMDLLDRGGYKPVDQVQELEPEKSREDIEGNVQQELMKALKLIPKEQRQALIDSVDQVKQ